jgi:hypothetical protein
MSGRTQKLKRLVQTANDQNRAGLSTTDARLQYGDILNPNWPGREGDREVQVISGGPWRDPHAMCTRNDLRHLCAEPIQQCYCDGLANYSQLWYDR